MNFWRNSHRLTLFLIIGFYLAIVAAWIGGVQFFREFDEHRTMQAFPKLAFHSAEERKSFLRGMESYVRDHQPFRNAGVLLANSLRFYVFGAVASKENFLGQNGWWYRTTSADQPVNQDFIDKLEAQLSEKVAAFEKQGIQYIFLITPAKHNIYPEFLPPDLSSRWHTSQGEILAEALEDKFNDHAPDIFTILRQGKSDPTSVYTMFLRDDMHWSQEGAGVVVRTILRPFYTINETPMSTITETIVGDQVRQSGVYKKETTRFRAPTTGDNPVPKADISHQFAGEIADSDQILRFKKQDGRRRLLITGSSFIWNMLPSLLRYFDEVVVVYHWGLGNTCDNGPRKWPQVIEKVNPSMIMVLAAETYLPTVTSDCTGFFLEGHLP